MPETTWTTPALEFYKTRIRAPMPSPITLTPDILMRWKPLLTGVEEARHQELVGVLEIENWLVSEILGASPERLLANKADEFERFLREGHAVWLGGDLEAQDKPLVYYYHAVKRQALGRELGYDYYTAYYHQDVAPEETVVAPKETSQESQEIVALRLVHKIEVDSLRRQRDAAKDEAELANRRTDAEKRRADEEYGKRVRLAADFDNYQKRVKRDQERDREAGLRKILGDIVTLLDNASLVVENAAKPEATLASVTTALASGVRGELMATLTRHGGKAMGVKPGDPLDPARHEVVSLVDEEGSPERDEVSVVVREGYLIGPAILRTASVVAKRVRAPKPVADPTPTVQAPPS